MHNYNIFLNNVVKNYNLYVRSYKLRTTSTNYTQQGKLDSVEKFILNKDYNNGNLYNSTLIGNNLMELNQIEVNRIYFSKLIHDTIYTIDSLSLVSIAYQSPSTGGKGVYGARVILGLDPYDAITYLKTFCLPIINLKMLSHLILKFIQILQMKNCILR